MKFTDKTYVMGILNVTPDSFSDGGEFFDSMLAISHAKKMLQDGADIIDIGGQSTRPGHTAVSADEEWRRLYPVISEIRSFTENPISVDTFYPSVAENALRAGADIINDVSGTVNPQMAEIVKKYGAIWVLMHAGEVDSAVYDVHEWLKNAAKEAISLGVKRELIWLDCGIGFGKTEEQNYELILDGRRVKVDGFVYLIGASRKRCIRAACGSDALSKRDSATHAAHTVAIMGGANVVRVHDVAGAVAAARITDKILEAQNG